MPKNIVICLDGTGNEVEVNISNVLKIYRTLKKNPTGRNAQVAYYNPGVGTLGLRKGWTPLSQGAKFFAGLAFGLGLDETVLNAYRVIAENYQETSKRVDGKRVKERDRIYIFGYSRGAYASRVLAGFIYQMGLLEPGELHLAESALQVYKQSASGKYDEGVDAFNRITQPRRPPIEMLGLFDTVSSVIVPRRDRFYIPSQRVLPYTRANPCVKAVYEAASIDEPRRMFRLEPWEEGQTFRRKPLSTTTAPQIFKRVWFAGYHGDVGGGNPRDDSGLSQLPFNWMVDKAIASGVHIDERMAQYVGGLKIFTKTTDYTYPAPDPLAKMHPSRNAFWTAQEYLPKTAKRREGGGRFRKAAAGVYFPRWEPRDMGDRPTVHESVHQRVEGDPTYRPVNLPGIAG